MIFALQFIVGNAKNIHCPKNVAREPRLLCRFPFCAYETVPLSAMNVLNVKQLIPTSVAMLEWLFCVLNMTTSRMILFSCYSGLLGVAPITCSRLMLCVATSMRYPISVKSKLIYFSSSSNEHDHRALRVMMRYYMYLLMLPKVNVLPNITLCTKVYFHNCTYFSV